MNDFEMIQTSFSAMRLTKDMIIAKSSGFDLDSVFNLSLAKLRIENLDPVINNCVSLETLDLSLNNIADLSALSGKHLIALKHLHLSCNRISVLRPLGQIPTLQSLYLQGNNIQNFDDLSAIGRKCLGIKTLYLKEINGSLANPVCSANNYRETMLAYFPNLKVLDGERLRKVDCIYRLTDEINKLFPSMQHEQDVIRRLQEEEKKKDSKAAMMDWIPYNCLIPTILQSEADIIADMQIKSLSNAVEDCTQLEKVCDDMVSSLGYQAKEIWMTELNKLTIGGVLTK